MTRLRLVVLLAVLERLVDVRLVLLHERVDVGLRHVDRPARGPGLLHRDYVSVAVL